MTNISIQWNTTILLNKLNVCQTHDLTVFIACKFINKNITIEKIQKILQLIENKKLSKYIITGAMKRLCQLGYLKYNEIKQLELNKEKSVNYRYSKELPRNYYNSEFIIGQREIKYYRDESNEKSWRNFLSGEIITYIFRDIPVTYDKIEKQIGLKKHTTKQLKLKRKKYYIELDKKKYISLIGFTKAIVCTGCIYKRRDFKITYNVPNYVREMWREDSFRYHARKRSNTILPYFSELKMEFVKETLSFNSLVSAIRNNKHSNIFIPSFCH